MDIIAGRYAESLFALAVEENNVAAYKKDMEKVQAVFEDESFVQFFSHVSLKDDVKKEVLEKSFKNQVSEYVYHFLMLLIDKRRIRYILGICEQFQCLCNEYLGIKVGKLLTPYELSPKEITKIEKAMSLKVDKTVQLRQVIDESLIGGVRVEIENRVYDDSLSYKLESMKKELLRK